MSCCIRIKLRSYRYVETERFVYGISQRIRLEKHSEGQSHKKKMSSLQTASIMGDGSLLVAADKSGQVHVWDATDDYKYIHNFQAHKGYILKCLFSPDLKYVFFFFSFFFFSSYSHSHTRKFKISCNYLIGYDGKTLEYKRYEIQ